MNVIQNLDRTLPRDVIPIQAPYLFALGGSISTDRPLSFIRPPRGRWLPVQGYVLRDADSFLLLDTGLTVHRQAVARGIESLLGDASERVIVTTRREPDSMINLPWIVSDYGIQTVYAGGELSPIDFFEKMEFASGKAHITAAAGVVPASLTPGHVISVGRLRLEVLRTTLRVLFTNWFYEEVTKTLFSSDSWGFITSPNESSPFVAEPNAEEISVSAISDFLDVKFDWLRGIDTSPIIADLRELVDARPIDRVCPSYGATIEGADSVRLLFDNTVEALRRLGAGPRVSPVAGYDLAALRRGD